MSKEIKDEGLHSPPAFAKLPVSRRLSEVDKQRAKAVETICIGIVAKNMGYANQTLVCNAGRELFELISRMTYKQFSDIKRLSNGG